MNNGNWKSDPEEDLRKLIAKHKAMDSEDSKSKDSVKKYMGKFKKCILCKPNAYSSYC